MSLLHAHPHESHLNFDPDSKPSVVRHPHETKSILIPTLKSSQLPSPTETVSFEHPHNEVNFDTNTTIMSFSGRVALRVMHTSTCSCDTAAIRIIQLRVPTRYFLTFPYYSKTANILRKHTPCLFFATWLRAIPPVRSSPCRIWVVSLNSIPAYYQCRVRYLIYNVRSVPPRQN